MTDHQDKSGKESRNFIVRFFSTLGPGLITGAADDDPSGIATYSIAGAQMGTAMLWTAFITWPFMIVDHKLDVGTGTIDDEERFVFAMMIPS